MEQGQSGEANGRSAGWRNALPFMKPKVHFRVYKSSQLDPTLSPLTYIHVFELLNL